ncbi:hypothetical protein C4D60_Mb11t00100 [Musa balbisiana]|uniref:Pectinesterase inhibitor domain-containing protein n=1 Tax=Musa balbisiana TaxID=52838 RepID=A0A4S8J0L4_MUSBA|nr:hypothetical protein C4D60_Mb11t00100 [Musa balbisiana]
MFHPSYLRHLLFFLLPFVFLPCFSAAVSETMGKACNQTLDSVFCITSLQAVPKSDSADLPALALIALNLTYSNVTSSATKLLALQREATSPAIKNSFEACLMLYNNIFQPLRWASQFFVAKHYDVAQAMFATPLFAPTNCAETAGKVMEKDGNNTFFLMLMTRKFMELSSS